MNKIISIAKPNIGPNEIAEVIKVLKSGELAQGKWVEAFENSYAQFVNTKYAIAVTNGTTALHLSLLGLGIKPGDEIITTPFTFIASTNAILYVGAKPVFVDICSSTFNIDPDLIEEKITPKTKAILLVHLFGLPAEMAKILKIAKKYHLVVLEDAAQAHGAKIKNRMVGSFGNAAAFSFYPTKNMTCGEGGIITTNNKQLANKLKILRNHGMKKRYHHEILGYNFRMTNIQAAIGIQQLKRINQFNQARINNAKYLTSKLKLITEIQTPTIPKNYTHVFHQYSILVQGGRRTRDKLATYLSQNEISSIVYYPIPVHQQKFLKNLYPHQTLPVTEEIASQILSLPIHPLVTKSNLQKIAKSIKIFFRK